MAHDSHITTNHDEIRRWVEERGGVPVRINGTGAQQSSGDPGILRINFPGYGEDAGGDTFEQIAWDEFFAKFDDNNLAFLYQEELASGETSRFFKLVKRETAGAAR